MIYALGLALLAFAWLMPGHYFPWTAFLQESVAAAGMAIVGLAALAKPGTTLRLASPAGAAFALALVPLLQWRFGLVPYFSDALLPLLYLCAFASAIVASEALTRADGGSFVMAFWATALAAAIVSTGIGLAQWLEVGPAAFVEALPRGERVYGNLVQPNHQSTLLLLGGIGALWLFEQRKLNAVTAAAAIAYLGMGLVMTQSRTAWLVLAIAGPAWCLMRPRLGLRTPRWAVVVGLVTFAVATMLWPHIYQAGSQTNMPSLASRLQVGTRSIHWAVLLDAVGDRPWFGFGWMQVGAAQQHAALNHPASGEWLSYSHSVIIDLLVWNGVPLGAGMVAACGLWLYTRMRRCSDVTSLAALTAIGALVAHALLEFPHAFTYFLLPLALLVGVVEADGAPPGPGVREGMRKGAYTVALASLTTMLLWVGSEYMRVDEADRRARLREAGYVMENAPVFVPDVVLLDSLREFIWVRLLDVGEGMDAATLDRMRNITTRYAPPGALLAYARAAGLNGREADAVQRLALLCSLWPGNPCRQGKAHWASQQASHPRLVAVSFPPSPLDEVEDDASTR
jgi:hypothetical protein